MPFPAKNSSLPTQKVSLAIICGTRPEIIKLGPLVDALKTSALFSPCVVATGQHLEMAQQAFDAMDFSPDYSLELMTPHQTPASVLQLGFSRITECLTQLKTERNIAAVVVHGDTTSALAGALAASNLSLPLVHVEAGLRSHDFSSPYPEEINRYLIAKLATLHYCPTSGNMQNLQDEGVKGQAYVVGNTVVDALRAILAKIERGALEVGQVQRLISDCPRFILVTAHRRENFAGPMQVLCDVLREVVNRHTDLHLVFPVHLNPNVQKTVYERLGNSPRIHLIPPLDYPSLLYAMSRSCLVVSDSGGIQEEAPSLGVHVLVTREITERPEAVVCGAATLTPLYKHQLLLEEILRRLQQPMPALASNAAANPFGDGNAAQRIVSLLQAHFEQGALGLAEGAAGHHACTLETALELYETVAG